MCFCYLVPFPLLDFVHHLNASLDQFRQGTTLVLKHNLGKCHVYDSFLHSSVPAVSWLGEGLCLFSRLFIISSFRSLYMDLGAKINFLKLLMAGGFYWPWNCMLLFLSKNFFFFFLSSSFYLEYVSNNAHHCVTGSVGHSLVKSANSNFVYSFILVSVGNVTIWSSGFPTIKYLAS